VLIATVIPSGGEAGVEETLVGSPTLTFFQATVSLNERFLDKLEMTVV
jgi:hypothetical protein